MLCAVPEPQAKSSMACAGSMLGWSRGNMRDRYGSGPWVKMLADDIQKVEYPLGLSHRYVR